MAMNDSEQANFENRIKSVTKELNNQCPTIKCDLKI